MDIWAWVGETGDRLRAEGHARLADLIDEIPDAVCSDEHASVDALVPEGVALARALELPWVELFFRHWHLQSRVLHRHEVAQAQREAVTLLELAHRDDARGCPQAICVVQDFAACHGLIDGPGYANERLAICRETLAKIGPRWPCFVCVSGEQADALLDAGDPLAALAFVREQRDRLREAGVRIADKLVGNEVAAELELGRAEAALARIDAAIRLGGDDHTRVANQLLRAEALTLLGRPAGAHAALPPLAVVRPTAAFWVRWARVIERLVESGTIPNEPALGETLGAMLDAQVANGVLRGALSLGAVHARLASARGDLAVAEATLATLERVAAQLRDPTSAQAALTSLRAAVARSSSGGLVPANQEQ